MGGGGGGGPGVCTGIEFGENGVDCPDAKSSTMGVPFDTVGGDCRGGSYVEGVRGDESAAESGEYRAAAVVDLGFRDAGLGGATDVASESVVPSVCSVTSEAARPSPDIVVLWRMLLGFEERVEAESGDSAPDVFRNLELELACRGPASVLLLPVGDPAARLSGVRMLLALAALRMSVVAVSGGLGGAAPVVAGLCPPVLPRSVVFGVYSEIRGFTVSSLTPTDSLLWAFENVGYELGFDTSGDPAEVRLCISGTTEAIFVLPLDECDTVLWAFSLLALPPPLPPPLPRSFFSGEDEDVDVELTRLVDVRVRTTFGRLSAGLAVRLSSSRSRSRSCFFPSLFLSRSRVRSLLGLSRSLVDDERRELDFFSGRLEEKNMLRARERLHVEHNGPACVALAPRRPVPGDAKRDGQVAAGAQKSQAVARPARTCCQIE